MLVTQSHYLAIETLGFFLCGFLYDFYVKLQLLFRRCGCGEGDSGCDTCGICRQCAEGFVAAARPEPAEKRRRTEPPLLLEEDEPKPSNSQAEGGKCQEIFIYRTDGPILLIFDLLDLSPPGIAE